MIAWFAAQPLPTQIGLAILAAALLAGLAILSYFRFRKFLELKALKDLEVKDRVGLKIEFVKTAAQILGGAFFLVTIYVAWQNLVVSQEKYKTDLFTRAIDQLGNVNQMEVRLGGIYALERIARDSAKDHGPIMEVLTAYVRLHAPWPPEKAAEAKKQQDKSKKPTPGEKKSKTEAEKIKPPADIQAILTVIGRRARIYKKIGDQCLDLRRTDLRGANLSQAHLEGANLINAHLKGAFLIAAHLEMALLKGAHLEEAVLEDAHLEEANLPESHLEGAYLNGAHLEGAELGSAHLEGANLRKAHLEGAILREAHLDGADLRKAHLEGAFLEEAYLEGAKLGEAHLEGAKLGEAHLERADLQEADLQKAFGLADHQVRQARTWVLAYLPGNLLAKLSLPPDHNQRLRHRNLSHYSLRGMDLRGAKLYTMNLKGAILSKAHLDRADLWGANLEGAELFDAHLEGADLRWTDLRRARGLTKEQIDSAIIDENTKLPDYLKKTGPSRAAPK